MQNNTFRSKCIISCPPSSTTKTSRIACLFFHILKWLSKIIIEPNDIQDARRKIEIGESWRGQETEERGEETGEN